MFNRPERNALAYAGMLLLLFAVIWDAGAGPEWSEQPGYRVARVEPTAGKAGFSRVNPRESGVTFTNVILPERHYTNQILLNGSGVAAGDVDGDGRCDLFFAGLGGRSALYRNLGDWKFQNVTFDSGLAACAKLDGTGCALADLDGDGDVDLVLNSVGQGTHCFWNDGSGRFAASPLVLNQGHCGSSLALADIDGDGTLDLYIANYRTSTIRDQPGSGFTFKTVNGKPEAVSFGGRALTEPDLTNRFTFVYKSRPGSAGGSVFHDELGETDVLYRNQGGKQLATAPFTGGAFLDEHGNALSHAPQDWGLSVMMRDFNADGRPDVYVCNDFATPDRFWLNAGEGRFRAAPGHSLRQTSLSTMALDVADIDRDGFDDIFTVDMLSRERWRRLVQRNEANANIHLFIDVERQQQSARNTLQLARSDGTYAEIAQLAGIEAAEWAWASIFLDVDLDGYEDLLVANGFERDYMNMDANRKVTGLKAQARGQMPVSEQQKLNRLYPRLDTANVAFRNLGQLRFADMSAAWGFDLRAVSQGMCLADLDNDGDMDVIINNSNSAATLLRNEGTAARVAVRLKGKAPNTHGIGAKIKLRGGAVPVQSQEMIAGGRYLSSDDAMRVFAAGAAGGQMSLEVLWPGRKGTAAVSSVITNIQANRIYEIQESGAIPMVASESGSARAPMFRDVSTMIGHRHSEEPFDDFSRQPLLPNKLSTLGPGISWFDVDSDGWEDLIIAGGKGRKMTVYQNRRGRFIQGADEALTYNQTAVLGWKMSNGGAGLLAGESHYEDGSNNGSVAQPYLFNGTILEKTAEGLPGSASATGPVALGDLDGDGQLELFVGGRCLPGRWPEAASSSVFRQVGGKWMPDPNNTNALAAAGLVSGAVFTDIDDDGDADLVLACEWGPLRVFRNERGALKEATGDVGLNRYTGWWNGVSAGDFDGDGRMDLLASNWGRNTKYERYRAKPLRIFYGDLNGDGSVELMEACYDEALKDYAPILNIWTMSRSMPWLLERFASYETFSRANVHQVLGDRDARARYLDAAWLESTVFLNRGERFEAKALPIEAQVAPAFAVCVADFDGDGAEDVFLSQNFFGTRMETSRYDAGRGLLLLGKGKGNFEAVPGQQSGVMIYGEQRGAAAADYDGDGRTDLAVTQVGAETRLYHNDTASPGLRVRLAGPAGNPQGIGAVIRLKRGDRLGPAREVHAGSGYWSQDGATQVMGGQGPAREIQVRWPGGKASTAAIPSGAMEISIDFNGTVKVIQSNRE